MKNETLINVAKEILKKLLTECSEGQFIMFKRMYCYKHLDLTINEAVDQMDIDKIDWAITQTEKIVDKNRRLLVSVY